MTPLTGWWLSVRDILWGPWIGTKAQTTTSKENVKITDPRPAISTENCWIWRTFLNAQYVISVNQNKTKDVRRSWELLSSLLSNHHCQWKSIYMTLSRICWLPSSLSVCHVSRSSSKNKEERKAADYIPLQTYIQKNTFKKQRKKRRKKSRSIVFSGADNGITSLPSHILTCVVTNRAQWWRYQRWKLFKHRLWPLRPALYFGKEEEMQQ